MTKPKAVALYSGGLDSTLAIIVMVNHGVVIEAVNFNTDLIPDQDSKIFHDRLKRDADKFGFVYRTIHLGSKFIDMVKNPGHGYGKRMNPCIDCKIMMLREAGDYMRKIDAQFVITGEVVGQRPMSQMKPTLRQIEKAAILEDLVVRPLSGKLLDPTLPEKQGLINRDWLMEINGRSRKIQLELAAEYGVEDYPTPAGGCLLTDVYYSVRLKDLFDHQETYSANEIYLLRCGRHFRLSPQTKLIVGRDENDNNRIEKLAGHDDYLIEVKDAGSPVAILSGTANEEDINLAAAIVAGYSDSKTRPKVAVDIDRLGQNRKIKVIPAGRDISQKYIL
jgi:tRNA U34 2-thiouridine synthase MnmA/TrmU